MSNSLWPHGLHSPWNSPGHNIGVRSLSWNSIVHEVAKSRTRLSNFHFLQSPYKRVPVHCLYLMSWKGSMNWLLKIRSNLDTLNRRVIFKRAVKVDVIVKWTITIPFPPFSQVRVIHPCRNHLRPTVGTSLTVQWLRLHTSTAGGADSVPGWGTKIPHARQHSHKNNK